MKHEPPTKQMGVKMTLRSFVFHFIYMYNELMDIAKCNINKHLWLSFIVSQTKTM